MQCGILDQILAYRKNISGKTGKIQIKSVHFLKMVFNFMVLITVPLVCTVNIRGTQEKHTQYSALFLHVFCKCKIISK